MVKIRKRFPLALLGILFLVMALSSVIVFGGETKVFDDANLFSPQEKNEIEAEATKLSLNHQMDIIVVTTRDANGKTSREYADDFYAEHNLGVGNNQSGILFLIDLDNGEVYISTSGEGIRYLTDQRIKNTVKAVLDSGLGEGAYFAGTKSFLRETNKYLESGIPAGQQSQDESVKAKNSLTPGEGIISLLSGIFLSAGFFFRTKSKYKMENPAKPQTFKENSLINLKVEQDNLLETSTVHQMISKPVQKDSADQSTTHTSASNKTHGGGGAKFK